MTPVRVNGDSWWSSMLRSFSEGLGAVPPSRYLFEIGALRTFVLPVDGEVDLLREGCGDVRQKTRTLNS